MRPALLFAACLLPGCAGTYLLPNVQTGKCYTVVAGDFGLMDLLIATGHAVDGWQCANLAEGDAYRTEATRHYVKPSTCPDNYTWNGNGCSAIARAPTPEPEPTWSTGE